MLFARTNFLAAAATAAALAGCSSGGPVFGRDGGADGAAGEGGMSCARAADCDDHTACTTDLCLVGGVCDHQADNTMCTGGTVCMSGRGCVSPTARTCRAQTDCDDHVACTRDSCLVDGTCRNQPDDTQCASGQVCDVARGCGAPTHCTSVADCDDHIPCTEDTCGIDGVCAHIPQNSRCAAGMTCVAGMGCGVTRACSTNAECDNHIYCDGVETCMTELGCQAGTPVDCADTDACTRDACEEATRMCSHTADPSCMGTTVRSGIFDASPAVNYSCTDSFFGMVATEFHVMTFQFSLSATALTVTGAPATMTGTRPTGASFDVQGVVRGNCDETYRLMGMFTDANHFTGTFSVSFSGSACGLTDCSNQSWPVTGTARP